MTHAGADVSYPGVAARAVASIHPQNPSPVYGYLRTGQQQKIFLFPTLDQAHAWYQKPTEAFDYMAVFATPNLHAAVMETFGQAAVSGDAAVGSAWPLALGIPAGALGGYFYRKWQEGHPGKIIPGISGELIGAGDPVWKQPKHVLRARGSRVAQYGNTKPGVGPYIGVELFGPPEPGPGTGHDLYRTFPSLDDASDWLANERGIVIYRAIYDATDPTWPSPISELFGNSQMTRMAGEIGADGPDAARMRAWPQTKALIQSAIREVLDVAATHPFPAYVWCLSAPSVSPAPNVQLYGTTEVVPFASREEAFDYVRGRAHLQHVACAVFERANPHWPNPVGWRKSDAPEYESVIAEQVAKYAPARAAGELVGQQPWHDIVGAQPWHDIVGAQPWHDIVGAQPWHDIVGQQPWHDIVGAQPWHDIVGQHPIISSAAQAAQAVRNRALALATAKAGHAVGVIHAADGLWHTFAFDSLDDADDWFGTAIREKADFTYAAYFGKGSDGGAHVENEAFGGPSSPRTRGPATRIPRGVATTDA